VTSVIALLRLAGRRLVALPWMILGITLLVFVTMQFSRVDPAINALGEGASLAAREAWREANGLNEPLLVRYWNFLVGLVQGDLGTFGPRQQPVADEVASGVLGEGRQCTRGGQ
jgi:peptide/nickel transport system permease protein